jgi:uncharacterized protein
MESVKLNKLRDILSGSGKAIIAFSGGVDSTFLLKVCADVLGKENTIAVTASSETYTAGELSYAGVMASELGVKHIILRTNELKDENFSSNPPDRCYYCKKSFITEIFILAEKMGIKHVLDGSNFDDESDYRPGSRASAELGIESPLRDAGLTKNDIREISKSMGLSSWDKPSSPCLASRIPYGERITEEKLEMVGKAEEFLKSLGFSTVRVRHHGRIARIEITERDFGAILNAGTRRAIIEHLKKSGFTWISVDLEGYRMGSLNETLDE